MTSSFQVTATKIRPNSIATFGSTVTRFNEKPLGSVLGPGQYKPRVVGKSHNSALAVAGSAAFKSGKRPEIINAAKTFDMPAPGEYTKQQLNRTFMQAMRQITKKD